MAVFIEVATGILGISTAALGVMWARSHTALYEAIDDVVEARTHVANLQIELSKAWAEGDALKVKADELTAELDKIERQRMKALEAARERNATRFAARRAERDADDAARRRRTVTDMANTRFRPRAEVVADVPKRHVS